MKVLSLQEIELQLYKKKKKKKKRRASSNGLEVLYHISTTCDDVYRHLGLSSDTGEIFS